MGESIVSMAQSALKSAFQDMEVKISLIWDPPWNPKMITMDGRAALGL
jgi:metal-sulfur cluster biosynthetic enzyme